jgi:hypothetical protein
MVPEALDELTGEERHRVYRMLRLEVYVQRNGDLEIRGVIKAEVRGATIVYPEFCTSAATQMSTPSANRASTPAPAAVSRTPPPTRTDTPMVDPLAERQYLGIPTGKNAPGSCPWTCTPTTGEPGGPRGSTQRAPPADDRIPNRTRRYAACLPISCRRSPDTHQRRSTLVGLGRARGGRLCRSPARSHGGAVRVAGVSPLNLRYRGTETCQMVGRG